MSSTTIVAAHAAPKARRSLKACRKCHERKVRCDVTRVGAPCSNCQCGKIDCILLDGKRRGRKKRQDSGYASQRTATNIPISPREQHFSPGVQNNAAGLGASTSTPSDTLGSSLAPEETSGSTSFVSDVACNTLPPYVTPFPKSLAREDIEFFSKKRLFNLPTPKFRDICLKSYVEWVHFFCPLLDLSDFLGSIAAGPDSSDKGVSLMLLYAVLLTGVAFVDESHILEAGYESRLAVRKEFFTKAKILYSFGYELDRQVISQSLLLMSYFQERHDEPTNHWYWAELGCVMARTIGLFLDPSQSNLSDRKQRLWKRIGWSCILRDRVLNLGVRMPPKVRQEEFRVPILTEEDFDPTTFEQEVIDLLPDCELLRDESLQRRLARMCIEKTKLCMILGDLFNHLYTESSPKLGETSEVTLILLPKSENLDAAGVAKIESDLQTWMRNLPNDVQNPQPTDPVIHDNERVAFAHCSMLHMFYQTIMCAFYRPQILAAPSPAARDSTTRRMSYATMRITRHFEDLQSYGLIQFLPSSAVTFLLTAAVNHLVEYKTVDEEETRQMHLRRFRDCLCYLKTLQLVHVYAKYGGIFLTSSARQEGIAIPPDPSAALQTANVPANPTDREGLGPWAVAHTPDVLMGSTAKQLSKLNLCNLRNEQGHSTTRSLRSTQNIEGMAEAPSVADSNLFDGNAYQVGDMNFQGWMPGAGQCDRDMVDVETLSSSSGFLNSTIWEHGWIDQIAENWLTQLPAGQEELGQVGLSYPDIPSMNIQ